MNKNPKANFLTCLKQCQWWGRWGHQNWKIISNPWKVEMINHFSTKEYKRRFVKNKHGTECLLQGGHAYLFNNVFLK